MLKHHVETISPSPADTLSRRRSFASLAGAALAAAFAAPPVAEAKKGGKNDKKKCKNKKKGSDAGICEEQLQPCRDFVDDFCALFNPPGPPRDACVAGAIVCCEPIMECDGEEVFECLYEKISNI
ncbi:MAG: hypothetical protein ACRDJC_19895 [Thermomicrobiales bacterium]